MIKPCKYINKKQCQFIQEWCKEAHLNEPVAYDYDYTEGFTIYTKRPGYLIGKGGELVNKYLNKLQNEFRASNKIKFIEIRGDFVNYTE